MADVGPRRTEIQRERDLAIVSSMYLRGTTQQAITDRLNEDFYPEQPLTRQMITYDIRVLIKRWQKSAFRDIDQRKAEELAKIDNLEIEYWVAWERSQRDAETVTNDITEVDGKFISRESKKREGQTGDPRFLTGVQWCIQKRCDILGIDAPAKTDLTTNGKDFPSSVVNVYIPDNGRSSNGLN